MLSYLKISNGNKIFQHLLLENIKQEQEFLISLPNNFELNWIKFMQFLRIFKRSVFICIEISILILFYIFNVLLQKYPCSILNFISFCYKLVSKNSSHVSR